MDEKTSRDSNTTMMALAALMFFAPFIHVLTKKGSLEVQDKEFVGGYITLGYFAGFLLLLTILCGIGNYFVVSQIFSVAYALSLGLLLLLLLIGTICILANVQLLGHRSLTVTFYQATSKKDLLLIFLPFYNVYLWYKLHAFGNPNRWIKESLLWRTFFVLFAITNHPLVLSVVLVLRLLRVATLMAGLDILHLQTKSDINTLFTKNPEEIRGYLTGALIFLLRGVRRIFTRSFVLPSLETCIMEEKDYYARLYNLRTSREIWIEYVIAGGLLWLYRYRVQPDITAWYVYLPLAVIVGRYLLMIISRGHLPHVPVAREVRNIISAPFRVLFPRHANVKA